MNRISEPLQEALTIRCPKTLEEAIQIGSEIEYTMNRSIKTKNIMKNKITKPTLQLPTTFENSMSEENTTTNETEQQHQHA